MLLSGSQSGLVEQDPDFGSVCLGEKPRWPERGGIRARSWKVVYRHGDSAADDASHPADRGRFPRAGQTTGPQSLVVSPRTAAAQPFESPSNSLQGS